MADNKAVVIWGGWPGHAPEAVADWLVVLLQAHGFRIHMSDTLAVLTDAQAMHDATLIVPVWTMGELTGEQEAALTTAVRDRGVGLAGCHGGMADAFRDSPEYQFMVGGQWVAHPGNDGVAYTVRVTQPEHFITQGAPRVFDIVSEQYYMHVDPAIDVLATTRFPTAPGPHEPNGAVEMPVVWTKRYGRGRVAYNSLGHAPAVLQLPVVARLMERAMLWAARADGSE